MGYMGFGAQRWISTMKPRKFLGKRSKPDGGGGKPERRSDIRDYYHPEKNDLANLKKESTRQNTGHYLRTNLPRKIKD